MNDAASGRGRSAVASYCTVDRVDCKLTGHPRVHGVADNATRVGIFDSTQVKLSLIGGMLGNIAELQLIWLICSEVSVD
jgi:hypothetical protein